MWKREERAKRWPELVGCNQLELGGALDLFQANMWPAHHASTDGLLRFARAFSIGSIGDCLDKRLIEVVLRQFAVSC